MNPVSEQTATAASGGPVPGADLRLVPPALAAWVGAAVGERGGSEPRAILSASVAVLVAGGLVALLFAGRAPGGRAVALAVAACLAGGLAAAAFDVRARTSGPLPGLASRHVSARIVVVVTGDPTIHPSRAPGVGGSADLIIIPVSVRRVDTPGRSWRLRQPVLLLVTGRGPWRRLLPSQHVDLQGRFGPPRSGDSVSAVVSVRTPPSRVGAASLAQRAAGRVRRGLRDAAGVLPHRERGLLPGLVLGDTSDLDEQVRDEFRAAGMTHIVAVSGANCVMVVAVVLAVARRVRLGVKSRALIASAALVGFVVLARPSPSVLRATVMGLLGLAAAGAGRPRATIPALSAAVLILLLTDPGLSTSPGFELSVLATAGLVVLAPGWGAALGRRLPPRFAEALAVPLAAQVACAPVIAARWGSVSTVAVIANLLALPAVPPATVIGVLAALAGPIWLPLARGLAWLAAIPCFWLVSVAHVSAHVPGASIGWPGGTRGAVLLTAASAGVVAVMRRRRARRVLLAACVGFIASRITVVPRLTGGWPPPGWRMVVCDVGQGDALVLPVGAGSAVLVDAGPDPAKLHACLRDLGIHRLPYVILSHLHADHVEGLPAVLGHLPVGVVEIGPLLEPPEEWARVSRWARDARVPVRRAAVGETRRLGPLTWKVLAPLVVLHGTDSDPNNNSVVVRVDTPDLSLLLPGDAEPEEQAELRGSPDLRVDVLKVPHHGSARQDAGFLAASGARVALISVGLGNPYGHPSSNTINSLSRDGMDVLRTDSDGAVAVSRGSGAVLTTRQRRTSRSVKPTGTRPRAASPARSPPAGFPPAIQVRFRRRATRAGPGGVAGT
jgi:competence protein ComEC